MEKHTPRRTAMSDATGRSTATNDGTVEAGEDARGYEVPKKK